MRILDVFLTQQQGSAERHSLTLLKQLQHQGHEVIYVGIEGSWLFDACRKARIEVKSMRFQGKLAILTTLQLIFIARQVKPDLIHTHMLQSSVFGQMVARITQIPQVVTLHNLEKAKRLPIDCHVIAPTHYIRKELMKQGLPYDKLHVVHTGIDIPKLIDPLQHPNEVKNLLRHKQSQQNKIFLLLAGDFTPEKGHDLLLDALSNLTPVVRHRFEVIFYGDNNTHYGKKITSAVNQHVMNQHIHIVNEGTVEHWLTVADVLVMPSRYENFPLPIIEAGLYGVGVIATRIGDIPEIIIDSQHGWLVHTENCPELSHHLTRLADKPDSLLQTASKLKQHVESEFSINKMVSTTEQIFQQQVSH